MLWRLISFWCFVLFSTAWTANAAQSPISTSASSSEARDLCLGRVMQAGGEDLTRLNPNSIADACHSFPLSDDVFVQVLGAMVGPDMLMLLDVYTALTQRPHGFDESSPLFTAAQPYHSVMLSANKFFLSVLLMGVCLSVFTQMLRWSKGEMNVSVSEWLGRHGSNHGISIALSLPILGWMTPLQALSLVSILLMGFVAKWAVTYLFLASFFGSTAASLHENVKDELQVNFGRAVMLQHCDIVRREQLVTEIQSRLGSRRKVDLEANSLYQCLTGGGTTEGLTHELPSSSATTVSFAYTPASLAQTDACVSAHKADLMAWGVDAPASCGVIQLTLPNNTAAPGSVERAIALYANARVLDSQRSLALKVNEFECRAVGKVPEYSGTVVSSCLSAAPSGSGYRYQYATNKITGEEELDYFKTPLSDVSRESFASTTKKELVELNQSIASNTPAILAHLTDLLAPFVSNDEIPASLQNRRDALAARLNQRFSEGGGLGFSQKDAEFLVSTVQRGPWAASSLFYGALADGVSDEGVVALLSQVYEVPKYANEGYFNTDLITIKNMQTIAETSQMDRFVADAPGWGLIVPRAGLYLDYVSCWHTQVDCEAPPLNPFTYLGTRGAQLIDEATMRYLGGSLIHGVVRHFMGLDRQHGARFMVLETLGEFQLLYVILGVVLAIAIPLLPTLKLLAMMVNWVYDVCRELLSLQIKIAMSPFGEQGDKVIGDDVREALNRLFALGVYFLFVILGVCVMFLIFSFLCSLNVFFVGSLSATIGMGSQLSSLDSLVMNMLMDTVIVFLLFYQVYKCTPYMERVPRMLMEYFEVNMTSSDSMVEQVFGYAKTHFLPGISSFLHESNANILFGKKNR